jgi:hypothetical protein
MTTTTSGSPAVTRQPHIWFVPQGALADKR